MEYGLFMNQIMEVDCIPDDNYPLKRFSAAISILTLAITKTLP